VFLAPKFISKSEREIKSFFIFEVLSAIIAANFTFGRIPLKKMHDTLSRWLSVWIFTPRLVLGIRRSLQRIRPAVLQKYCQGKSASPFVTKILFDIVAHIAHGCVYITRQIRIFVSAQIALCKFNLGEEEGEPRLLPLRQRGLF